MNWFPTCLIMSRFELWIRKAIKLYIYKIKYAIFPVATVAISRHTKLEKQKSRVSLSRESLFFKFVFFV